VQGAWLVLDKVNDIHHNVVIIDQTPLDSLLTFTYNSTDCSDPCHRLTSDEKELFVGECIGICGDLVFSLTYPSNAPEGLKEYVYLEND
jgi:hypothetical protein